MRRYIDADLLKFAIEKNFAHGTITPILQLIDGQPTADVRENVHGEWVNGYCDQCGEHAPYWSMASTYYKSDYCPNCGADMRKGETNG